MGMITRLIIDRVQHTINPPRPCAYNSIDDANGVSRGVDNPEGELTSLIVEEQCEV